MWECGWAIVTQLVNSDFPCVGLVGPHVFPWALMGWALMGRALMGRALMGEALMGRALPGWAQMAPLGIATLFIPGHFSPVRPGQSRLD